MTLQHGSGGRGEPDLPAMEGEDGAISDGVNTDISDDDEDLAYDVDAPASEESEDEEEDGESEEPGDPEEGPSEDEDPEKTSQEAVGELPTKEELEDWVVRVTGALSVEVPPELSEEAKERMESHEISAYETDRKIIGMEARLAGEKRAGLENQLVAALRENSASHNISPKAILSFMRDNGVLNPFHAATLLAGEQNDENAFRRGFEAGMKKAGKPIKPARKTVTARAPVKNVKSYKTYDQRHRGGLDALARVRASRKG